MKLVNIAGILILSSPVAVSLFADQASRDQKGSESSEVVGTWKSPRSILSIHPDRRFEVNGGPKIEYGIWEESGDSGFYLRYRAKNVNDAGLSRAGHFVMEQGDIVFYHDDEVERFKRVESKEETNEEGNQGSDTPAEAVPTIKIINEFSKQVASYLDDFKTLKPGMTRAEINQSFPTDGGIHRISIRRYTHPECPYFKVDVEFEVKADPENQGRPLPRDDDRAISISKPYLEGIRID